MAKVTTKVLLHLSSSLIADLEILHLSTKHLRKILIHLKAAMKAIMMTFSLFLQLLMNSVKFQKLLLIPEQTLETLQTEMVHFSQGLLMRLKLHSMDLATHLRHSQYLEVMGNMMIFSKDGTVVPLSAWILAKLRHSHNH